MTLGVGSYFNAITLQRLAHRLYKRHVPVLPKLIDLLIFLIFNSTFRHTAEIGKGTVASHRGMSCGVHAHAKIGERVFIGIHALVGGRAQDFGAPLIEDDVFIGMNAVVLCGRVGKGAIIGASSLVLDDVPAGAVVAGNPARLIRTTDQPWWARPKKELDTLAHDNGAGARAATESSASDG
jgi:serine O-acetyltransferase